jgi:secreted PhoX family phosphatase
VWQVNPITGAFVRLDWIGNYSHEGIGIDLRGNLYLGDEARGGALYKAVPNDKNDLTKGGTLYYLVGTATDASGWKQVVDPVNASVEAAAGGAVLFDRPEDFDEANGRVYFTVTEAAADADPRVGSAGQVVNRGGVYSVSTFGVPDLATQSGALPYNRLAPMIEVNDPKYVTQDQAKAQQGLQFPDNIAFDGLGHLWVHEDIPDNAGTFPASGVDVTKQARDQQDELYVYVLNAKGDRIVANPDTSGPAISGGYKAADMRTSAAAKPCENEFTGGIFGGDGKTLFINQQHYDNPTLSAKFG